MSKSIREKIIRLPKKIKNESSRVSVVLSSNWKTGVVSIVGFRVKYSVLRETTIIRYRESSDIQITRGWYTVSQKILPPVQ